MIEIRKEILRERDGPMLRHGLQEANGRTLLPPRHDDDRPDVEFLEERYEQFRQAV